MKRTAGIVAAAAVLSLLLVFPAAAETEGRDPLSYNNLSGIWTMTEGEIEGWHYTTAEVGADSQLVILAKGPDERTLSCWYEDQAGNDMSFTDLPLKKVDGSLYEGCGNDAWYAAAKTGTEGEEYDVTLIGEDRLLLMHFFGTEEAPGVSAQWYQRNVPSAAAPAPDEIKGSWNASDWPDGTGTLWESSVEILNGGGMRYAYGHPGQMYETYYSGIWEYQEDIGALYFYLHLTDNLGGGEKEEYIEGSVNVSRVPGTTDQLRFRSTGGATLLPEKEGDVVIYNRSVG